MRDQQFSLSDLLRDEVTLAALRADGLSVEAFESTLRAAARRLPAASRPAPPAHKVRGGWLVPYRLGSADHLCCGA